METIEALAKALNSFKVSVESANVVLHIEQANLMCSEMFTAFGKASSLCNYNHLMYNKTAESSMS